MFATPALTALLALAAPLIARADVTPSQPGPGDVFNAGSTCQVTWTADPDSTTVWKNMAIELMSGSNLAMVHITTVATGQDGTVDGEFTFPCPEMDPYSAIYFYQFTSPLATDKQWTTRFTIASPTGATTPPANATQPGSNAPIPWGVGNLLDTSKATPPPTGASGTGGTLSAVASSTASSVAPTMVPQTTASPTLTTLAIKATTSSSTSLNVSQNQTTTAGGSAHAPFDFRVWVGVASLVFTAIIW